MTTIQAIEKIEASLETLRAHCHSQAAHDAAYGNTDGAKHWTTLAAGVRLALDELRHHLEAHRQAADEPDSAWICDERVGCVAVYRAPQRQCLSGIQQDPDCIFYRHGDWNDDEKRWTVREEDAALARRIAEAMSHQTTCEAPE